MAFKRILQGLESRDPRSGRIRYVPNSISHSSFFKTSHSLAWAFCKTLRWMGNRRWRCRSALQPRTQWPVAFNPIRDCPTHTRAKGKKTNRPEPQKSRRPHPPSKRRPAHAGHGAPVPLQNKPPAHKKSFQWIPARWKPDSRCSCRVRWPGR